MPIAGGASAGAARAMLASDDAWLETQGKGQSPSLLMGRWSLLTAVLQADDTQNAS